jgi:adenylate cyclase
VIGVLLVAAGALRVIDWHSYDYLSAMFPPTVPAKPKVVVVAIDEPSFAQVEEQWPWPRGIHARLIDALDQAGAAAIAFDVIFADPSEPAQDSALVEAADRSGRVVLASDEAVIDSPHVEQTMAVEPMPELVGAGASVGFAGVELDGDGILRRLPARLDGFARAALDVWSNRTGRPRTEAASDPDRLMRFLPAGVGFPVVSYYQALQPESFLPPGLFDGAIVLIGLVLNATPEADQLAADSFLTPLVRSHGQVLSGVEVQANAILNLAAGLSVAPASWLTSALVLALFVGSTGLWIRNWTPARAVTASLAGALAAAAISLAALDLAQVWIAPPVLVLGVLSTVLAEGATTLMTERRGRREIKAAFGRYLSPELVEILARDPSRLRLEGERREMTFLFCDVRGFTTLSEQLQTEPERLTRIINRFLTAMTTAIRAKRGTIDKFMGDCVMAFWNAPLDEPDHAMQACTAALDMLGALDRLNTELAKEGVAPLRVGIGINTGPCVVGNMGSEERFAYSAMGDAVNLASRLEGLGQHYGVTITLGEATAFALNGRLPLLELDLVAVKGKTEPVRIYTLLGDARRAADARLAGLTRAQCEMLAAYRHGDWEAAQMALLRVRGHPLTPKALGEAYAARLESLASAPAPPDWDGVLRLMTK